MVIRSELNLGFSGGVNHIIQRHDVQASDAVLLLNTDATLTKADIGEMMRQFSAHRECAAFSPVLSEFDGSKTVDYCGARNMGRHLATRCRSAGSTSVSPSLLPVPFLSGTALLCRTSALRHVGFLDERYFFSGEIADLCQRLSDAGMVCAVCMEARVVHDLTCKSHQRSVIHLYYALRNRFLFVRTHESRWRQPLQVVVWVSVGFAMVTKALLQRDRARARAAFMAVLDGVRGRYGNRHEALGH